MPGLPTEDQVHLIAGILRSLGSDPTWEPQAGLRPVLPCSFSDLTEWTNRMPDPDVHRVMEEVFSRMSFINEMSTLDPTALEELGSIAPDDPRLPGFIAELSAAWPRPEQVDEITGLYRCVARTVRQMAESRPNLPADSPVAKGLDEAARALGINVADIGRQLEPIDELLAQLEAFVPSVSVPLRVVHVFAPEINRVFSRSGSMIANDTVAPVILAGTKGEGFLQSRSGTPGEPGTAGAGLSSYFYRLSLSGLFGDAAVRSLEVSIARPATLNLSDAGVKAEAEVFVVTQGGLGTIAPSRAEIVGDHVVLTFDPPLRAGEDSYFIGIAASGLPVSATARIRGLAGNVYEVNSVGETSP